jgi:hypothetical protein
MDGGGTVPAGMLSDSRLAYTPVGKQRFPGPHPIRDVGVSDTGLGIGIAERPTRSWCTERTCMSEPPRLAGFHEAERRIASRPSCTRHRSRAWAVSPAPSTNGGSRGATSVRVLLWRRHYRRARWRGQCQRLRPTVPRNCGCRCAARRRIAQCRDLLSVSDRGAVQYETRSGRRM